MITFPVEVYRPRSLSEFRQLGEGAGNNRWLLAGGTDLIPRLRRSDDQSGVIIDLTLLRRELNYIEMREGRLCLGALATHDQICRSLLVNEKAPVLAQACRVVGSQQIRNQGTIGGNIANASPAGDSLPALLALDAEVCLYGKQGGRVIPLNDFLLGPGQTQLKPGELITCVRLPKESLDSRGSFRKLGLRNALTIAVASVAVVLDGGGRPRVAYGSLAPRPVRAGELEAALLDGGVKGQRDLSRLVNRAVNPISDLRASAWYRREMAVNLTYISFDELKLIPGREDYA